MNGDEEWTVIVGWFYINVWKRNAYMELVNY